MGTIKTVVSVLHILVAIFLIATILLQSSKRTGLSGSISGAAENFFGKSKNRGLDSLLSRLTTIGSILFLFTSLYLAYNFALGTPAEATQTPDAIENPIVSEQTSAPQAVASPQATQKAAQ